jgi:hypothetical protein
MFSFHVFRVSNLCYGIVRAFVAGWLSIWNEGGKFWCEMPASRNEPRLEYSWIERSPRVTHNCLRSKGRPFARCGTTSIRFLIGSRRENRLRSANVEVVALLSPPLKAPHSRKRPDFAARLKMRDGGRIISVCAMDKILLESKGSY